MATGYLIILFGASLMIGADGQASTRTTTASPPDTTPCNLPPEIPGANKSYTGLGAGDIVTYTCNPGKQARGSTQQTCREGRWVASGNALTCMTIYCPRPPSIPSGSSRSFSSSSYTVGTVVTYTCFTGYFINDSSAEISCLANRTWSQPRPTCQKKDCGQPVQIQGANVTYSTTNYFSLAYYSCKEGYSLYSNGYLQRSNRASVRCLSTGLWANRPECRPKDCGLPSNIANGIRYSKGNHLFGDVVQYECNHGFMAHGNSSITCKANGRWSLLPECRKVMCEPPPVVRNATSSKIGKAGYGNTTVYTCSKGFEMNGPAQITCQADGTWTQVPTCSAVDCRTPPAIHFGSHQWVSTTYNSVAEYSCDEGYKLIGVAKVYCKRDGRWTDAPSCEIPPGSSGPVGSSSAQVAQNQNSALTGLAIACALFGVITLLCLVILIYKVCSADRPGKLFSYASYKNGDDAINSNI